MDVRALVGLMMFLSAPSDSACFPFIMTPDDEGARTDRGMGKSIVSSVSAGGMEFSVQVAREWEAPPPGGSSAVDLHFRWTNQATRSTHFRIIDTMTVSLQGLDGRERTVSRGRDATNRAARFSPAIPPGQSYSLDLAAKLEARDGGTFRLSCPDGVGGLWWIDEVKPGSITLRITYANDRATTDSGGPLWTGQARSSNIQVTIRPAPVRPEGIP